MAQFNKAYEILTKVEFSNNPDKFLHHNQGEATMTLGGIYRKANPDAIDWNFVDRIVKACEIDNDTEYLMENQSNYEEALKRASRMLYADKEIQFQVYTIFKKNYWDPIRLDEVQSQKIANEIFLFGVVSGVKNSVKLAQRLIGVKEDGILGNITIKALNIYNENMFDLKFDMLEKEYYDALAIRNPKLNIYLDGWYNRAEIV